MVFQSGTVKNNGSSSNNSWTDFEVESCHMVGGMVQW